MITEAVQHNFIPFGVESDRLVSNECSQNINGQMLPMDSPCTLSVLVTAHNCEKYIVETLNSLKKACSGIEDAVEIVLVNDASTDNTSELLHTFAASFSQVKIFDVMFRNIGKVRNFGVSKCSGHYVTMLDGDDQLLQNSFTDIVQFLQAQQPDILLAPLNEVYEKKTKPHKWKGLQVTALSQHLVIEKFLIHRDIQAHFIGQFIRRSLLVDNRFPDFSCYEDAYLFPSILKASEKIFLAKFGPYLYFKREKSLSSALDAEKISMLIKATQQMDAVLGETYRNLLACHWINLAHKFYPLISDEHEKGVVKQAIENVPFASFMMDSKVRFSLKKKFLKMKLRGMA
ncbi:glycosyltransferase family 2 protein [Pantoea sp. SOD02]|uniref:glycosyltransferase family 2 protein n=1 Tax=Pantoea sp. SOD02 TaxID=2970818 RepID=UPI002157DDFC|nr:glycosyltransferase family 2 protein [Pantoea sp. SOD02]UVC29782.1 glycosyltransferase [Pantoea sp. SOD02]